MRNIRYNKISVNKAPFVGNLVNVRNTKYIVKDVHFTAPSYRNQGEVHSVLEEATHKVTLASIEDDGVGKEIEVYWEKEPGAHILQEGAFPKANRFDHPDTLDQFLLAVRWGLVASSISDDLHAPFRSGIDIEDYQLDPLIRSLQMPRANLLIADDVGLGKTIEAGLIIQEFILRHKARSVLVVCPSTLQIQWKEQMRDKFGLEFRIVDADTIKELRKTKGLSANPWTHYPRLITSIDYIKREKPFRMMLDLFHTTDSIPYPRRFDFLVVDEAHMVAPSSGGKYSVDSQRTTAIRTIAPHFEHKLFLTATPHNGHSDSFTSLLETLDNQRFTKGIEPDPIQKKKILIRRLKTEIAENSLNAKFPKREICQIELDYSEKESKLHKLLHDYTNTKWSDSKTDSHRTLIYFVLKLLKKRLFSSPIAFFQTFQKHLENQSKPKTQKKKEESLLKGEWGRVKIDENLYDVENDEVQEEQEVREEEELLWVEEELGESYASSANMEKVIQELLAISNDLSNKGDSKFQAFLSWIQTNLRSENDWNRERLIVFTEYRTTQKWLFSLLDRHGLAGGDRIQMLDGSTDEEDRERIKNEFLADPDETGIRILLATDAASQGINLHHNCRYLIHYDIPWNPNRLEQRNGRLDRHGQKSPFVNIYHFIPKEYKKKMKDGGKVSDWEGDLEFLGRIVGKVEEIRRDLGSVSQVMTEDMTRQIGDVLSGKIQRRELPSVVWDERSDKIRKALLKIEKSIQKDLKMAMDQYQKTKSKLAITPDNIAQIVNLGLKLAGQLPLEPVIWDGHTVYRVPELVGSWKLALEGLGEPLHHEKRRPISFDAEFAQGKDKIVLAHLNHKLVKMALGLVRKSLWASEIDQKLSRYTVVEAPDDSKSPTILFFVRYLWVGSSYDRLDESMEIYGIQWNAKSKGFISEKKAIELSEIKGLNPASKVGEKWVKDNEEEIRNRFQECLEQELVEVRKKKEEVFSQICKEEESQVRSLLEELSQRIEAKFKQIQEMEDEFIPGLTTPESKQFYKDKEWLKKRQDMIPEEIVKETEKIRKKYGEPEVFSFPVAVKVFYPKGGKL